MKKNTYNKHGLSNHKIYRAWTNIVYRCTNKKDKYFKDYGERGITVCNEWKNDFMSFYNWSIENGYKDSLTIDRIDNNGNYEPSNCRWTTMTVQGRNTRILYAHNTSGYRGVSFKKDKSKWVCRIKVNGKNIHIGYGSSALECAKLYDQYVINNNLEHTRNFN